MFAEQTSNVGSEDHNHEQVTGQEIFDRFFCVLWICCLCFTQIIHLISQCHSMVFGFVNWCYSTPCCSWRGHMAVWAEPNYFFFFDRQPATVFENTRFLTWPLRFHNSSVRYSIFVHTIWVAIFICSVWKVSLSTEIHAEVNIRHFCDVSCGILSRPK